MTEKTQLLPVTQDDLKALGYLVVDASNPLMVSGWIIYLPNITDHVLLAASEDAAWDMARRHYQQSYRISHSLPGDGAQEPWPGCYADLQQRRVVTLANLGLMLSRMMRGGEIIGYDPGDLRADVLMALAIEDADDTDFALEIARDHPEHDCLAALTPTTPENPS